MARRNITAETWEKARADYEFNSLSYSQLSEKYGISKGALSKRVKSEGWLKGTNEQLVHSKVTAIQELTELDKQIETLPVNTRIIVNAEIDRRVRLAGLMSDGIEKAQVAINDLLDDSIAEAQRMKTVQERATLLIPVTDAHSKVTGRNVKSVFGNEGAAQQKGSETDEKEERRNSLAMRLLEKHGGKRG